MHPKSKENWWISDGLLKNMFIIIHIQFFLHRKDYRPKWMVNPGEWFRK